VVLCGVLELHCTVQYSTVLYSSIQYSRIQYSTVQCRTVEYSTVQYSTVPCSTVQCSTVQYVHCYQEKRSPCRPPARILIVMEKVEYIIVILSAESYFIVHIIYAAEVDR
jgi:hypothetical protein